MQVGVFLSKELMAIAGRSLKANITTLGPLVLPWTEQARYLANFFARKVGSLHAFCQGVNGVSVECGCAISCMQKRCLSADVTG